MSAVNGSIMFGRLCNIFGWLEMEEHFASLISLRFGLTKSTPLSY